MSRPTSRGQVRQLVHEADAGGQHRVGRVLGQLGRLQVHGEHALLHAIEGRVQPLQQVPGTLAGRPRLRADDDAVGPHEVVDRRAFLQELGIGRDREGVHAMRQAAGLQRIGDGLPHALAGAHRHGGLGHHQREALQVAPQALGRRQHLAHVGAAVLGLRRADGDELHLRMGHGLCAVGGEAQAAVVAVALDDVVQARFVDRHLAAVEHGDAPGVQIQAEHVVAHVGQAGRRDQADIAGAHHGDVHRAISGCRARA